jgi:hypothetical protein
MDLLWRLRQRFAHPKTAVEQWLRSGLFLEPLETPVFVTNCNQHLWHAFKCVR